MYGALCAAAETDVVLLTKGPLLTSASYLAQGGVAAAIGEDDSPELHAEDTLRAGRGLCRPSAVAALTAEAPARVADLVDLGVPFDDDLGLEGGHSRRRVVHAEGAATGAVIARVLAERVLEHPRIHVHEGERCSSFGGRRRATASDGAARPVPAVRRCSRPAATRRCGSGRRTRPARSATASCSPTAAGAAVADLELVQFHPTVVAGNGCSSRRRSAARARCSSTSDGERFTDELAPRDVVARAIDERGTALLDLRPIDRGRFPALIATLGAPASTRRDDPIPVSPAAHYTMGGIVTDLDGRTARARAVRGGRVRLHRRPRRQPPRLELAARVPGLRPSRRARGARASLPPQLCRGAAAGGRPGEP